MTFPFFTPHYYFHKIIFHNAKLTNYRRPAKSSRRQREKESLIPCGKEQSPLGEDADAIFHKLHTYVYVPLFW